MATSNVHPTAVSTCKAFSLVQLAELLLEFGEEYRGRAKRFTLPGLESVLEELYDLGMIFTRIRRHALSIQAELDANRLASRSIDCIVRLHAVLRGEMASALDAELSEDDILTTKPVIEGPWNASKLACSRINGIGEELTNIRLWADIILIVQNLWLNNASRKEVAKLVEEAMDNTAKSRHQGGHCDDDYNKDEMTRNSLIQDLTGYASYWVDLMPDAGQFTIYRKSTSCEPPEQDSLDTLGKLSSPLRRSILHFLQNLKPIELTYEFVYASDIVNNLLYFTAKFYPSRDFSTDRLQCLYRTVNATPAWCLEEYEPRRQKLSPLVSLQRPYLNDILARYPNPHTTAEVTAVNATKDAIEVTSVNTTESHITEPATENVTVAGRAEEEDPDQDWDNIGLPADAE